jgi:hypothetical protein
MLDAEVDESSKMGGNDVHLIDGVRSVSAGGRVVGVGRSGSGCCRRGRGGGRRVGCRWRREDRAGRVSGGVRGREEAGVGRQRGGKPSGVARLSLSLSMSGMDLLGLVDALVVVVSGVVVRRRSGRRSEGVFVGRGLSLDGLLLSGVGLVLGELTIV